MDGWSYTPEEIRAKAERGNPGLEFLGAMPITTGLWLEVLMTDPAGIKGEETHVLIDTRTNRVLLHSNDAAMFHEFATITDAAHDVRTYQHVCVRRLFF